MKIAVIPARGGSKRIPRKNIREFLGKPIIAYSIECAKSSGLFDLILVSTDDDEIASVAEYYGAQAPFRRPAELSNDHAGTPPVIRHALQWALDHLGPVDYACCIYATAPFVQTGYLRKGHDRLLASDKAYAFSVTTFAFPIQRAIRINGEGFIEAMQPEYANLRSQDLEQAYHDAGQFYWGRVKAFLEQDVLFSPVSIPIVLPRYLVQDIDTPEDWHRAELMYRALQLSGSIIP